MRQSSATVQKLAALHSKLLSDDAAWNERLEPCTYCGRPASSIDHVPPRSVRPKLIATGLTNRYPFVEVPACRECNSILGARPLFTVSERRKYMKSELRRRYASVLRIPDWTDSELAQLSAGMRRHVLTGIELRDYTLRRIEFASKATREPEGSHNF